jgi:TolA-binding protein
MLDSPDLSAAPSEHSHNQPPQLAQPQQAIQLRQQQLRIEALEKALLETQEALEQQTEKEDCIELQIQSLGQKLAELTIEPVFTPYEDNGPLTFSELQDDPNEEEDLRSFAPIPMDQLVEQREYDEDYSISTHSSMPELIYGYISPGSSIPDLESITEDENEMANRGELYKHHEDSEDSEVGF